MCTKLSLLDQNLINIYFHQWEFENIEKFDIPAHIKNKTGKPMVELLKNYIEWCLEKDFRFNTINEFLNQYT